MPTKTYDNLMDISILAVNRGDIHNALTLLQRAISELDRQITSGGIPSSPPTGCYRVTNMYVENGKLRVEYDEV